MKTKFQTGLVVAALALAAPSCFAIQTVKPATSSGVQLTTMSAAAGNIIEFYGRYESDFGGAESGLGLKVAYDASKLLGATVDQVMTKCMIASPQTQTGLALPNSNNAQVVMGWIDTSQRSAGAVGWPGVADPAGASACLNPGGIVTQTGAVAVPTTLFRFRATLATQRCAWSVTATIRTLVRTLVSPNSRLSLVAPQHAI
jgi:hypothetical protein